jgi:hypothetical protein
VLTDVSEENIASIFRVEGKIRRSSCEDTMRAGNEGTGLHGKSVERERGRVWGAGARLEQVYNLLAGRNIFMQG